MNSKYARAFAGVVFLAGLALSACSAQPTPASIPAIQNPTQEPTPAHQTYSDPFEYCAAVGTIDMPDASYTGEKITDGIINGFKIAAGLKDSTMPLETFQKTTLWRCMDDQVYACNFGANLPCSSKANTDKAPSQAMQDYCKTNPDAATIPMSVTGRSTVYSWRCVKDAAELLNQIENVDAAGYLAQIWYPISPVTTPEENTPPVLVGGSDQLVFASNRGGAYDDLYLLDLTNAQITRLTQGESSTFPGPFSPDGSHILFTGFGLTTSYVGVMSADGTNPVDLTKAEVDEGFAAWSPDGTRIAFTTRQDGNNEIYVMNADGSGRVRLTNSPKDDFAPAWSPDGSRIAFVSDREREDGYNSIYIMNANGSNVTRLTKTNGIDYTPTWSPDGKKIAFRSSADGTDEIWVINTDGSGLTNLTNDKTEDWSPAWSPDGTLIAFQTNRDGNWEIYIMNADGSNPRNLTNNPVDDQMPYWK